MREELDFKSLRFFSALYRLGNVSPAADALDISQPTGSLLLKKLRDHFADPLFVRVGQRMIPTPRADAIAPTISTLWPSNLSSFLSRVSVILRSV